MPLPPGYDPLLAMERLAAGLAHHQAGRLAEAGPFYAQAMALDPENATAHHLAGVLLLQAGRPDVAVSPLTQATELRPDYPEAFYNLGNALKALGQAVEAAQAYTQALALKPDFPEAFYNLALILQERQDFASARRGYESALALAPALAEALANLALIAKEDGDRGEAARLTRRALALRPAYPEALANFANLAQEAGEVVEAERRHAQALALAPAFGPGLSSLATLRKDQGRLEEALALYARAIALDPTDPEPRGNHALALLLAGRLAEGFEAYEWRWRARRFATPWRDFPQPLWAGEDLAGRTILLHAEQGLGDILHFVRYAPLVAARGGRVVLEAPAVLRRLLTSVPGVAEVVAKGDPLPGFHLHCPLLSLGRVFATTLASVPAPIPYLAAEPERRAFWRRKLASQGGASQGKEEGLRIGINWQGNPQGSIDQGRSVPLAAFAPLAAVKGARLISLQKGHGLGQLADLPAGMSVETLGPDFDAGPDAFLDTAAVMAELDLIVTSDTAMPHLAGALGRPCWLALKAVPEWRWLMAGEASPWYPSLRLFRQTRAGDWDDVFAGIARELSGRAPDPKRA